MPVTLDLGIINNDYIRCVCSCHQIMQWSSPLGLRQFIGRLHVLFRWNIIRRCDCTTTLCGRTKDSNKLTITYFFPSTLVHAMLTSSISRDRHENPAASLTIYNVISKNHTAWQYIVAEDILRLKVLFMKGNIRPSDTNELGESLLSVCYLPIRSKILRNIFICPKMHQAQSNH